MTYDYVTQWLQYVGNVQGYIFTDAITWVTTLLQPLQILVGH